VSTSLLTSRPKSSKTASFRGLKNRVARPSQESIREKRMKGQPGEFGPRHILCGLAVAAESRYKRSSLSIGIIAELVDDVPDSFGKLGIDSWNPIDRT